MCLSKVYTDVFTAHARYIDIVKGPPENIIQCNYNVLRR